MKQITKCILKELGIQFGIAIIICVVIISMVQISVYIGTELPPVQASYQSGTGLPTIIFLGFIIILTGIAIYYGTIKPCLIRAGGDMPKTKL
jgi:hypothetical protein